MSGDPARDNLAIAQAWLAAFNAHDVEALVALYGEGAVHTSPKLRAQHPETGGRIVGKAALTDWWRGGMERMKTLRYEPLALTSDAERVWLEYLRHAPGEPVMAVAEVFEVREGKIVASRVYHG